MLKGKIQSKILKPFLAPAFPLILKPKASFIHFLPWFYLPNPKPAAFVKLCARGADSSRCDSCATGATWLVQQVFRNFGSVSMKALKTPRDVCGLIRALNAAVKIKTCWFTVLSEPTYQLLDAAHVSSCKYEINQSRVFGDIWYQFISDACLIKPHSFTPMYYSELSLCNDYNLPLLENQVTLHFALE